jgi:anti-sigma factor ChrR (cupin superfamily)
MSKISKDRKKRPRRDPLIEVTPWDPDKDLSMDADTTYQQPTDLNADFDECVIIDTSALDWAPSPLPGVERRMLDRVGGEVARATSVVRFAPKSRFAEHEHGGGEEFLVLDGVFSDEDGDHPAGSYVRNPPGTRHAPFSEPGCTLLVKLWQMRRDGSEPQFAINTSQVHWQQAEASGYQRMSLFAPEDGTERVAMEKLDPGTTVPPYVCHGGEEIFVVSGVLTDGSGLYRAGTWMRHPPGFATTLMAGEEGCVLWIKRDHLADLDLTHFR